MENYEGQRAKDKGSAIYFPRTGPELVRPVRQIPDHCSLNLTTDLLTLFYNCLELKFSSCSITYTLTTFVSLAM